MRSSFLPPSQVEDLRARMYSRSVLVYACATGAGVFVSVLVVLRLLHSIGLFEHSSWTQLASIGVMAAVGAGAGTYAGERKIRRGFHDARDRAAYMRALDTENVPPEGIPAHWVERMHTDEKNFVVVTTLLAVMVIFPLVVLVFRFAAGDALLPGVLFAVVLVGLAVVALVPSILRIARASRLVRNEKSRR